MNKNKTLPKAWEEIDKHAQSFLSKEGGEILGNLGLPNGSITARSIELKYSTPFIDFHFGNSDSDYTSRIIENESGVLTVSGKLTVNGGITGSLIGNSTTATTLQTARTFTIGNTGKVFNGSINLSWSLSEIGAAASSHTHNYAGSSSAGGVANSSYVIQKNSSFNDSNIGRISYYDADIRNTSNNATWSAPSSGWHQIIHNDLSVANYWTELAFPVNDINGLAWRQRRSGSYYGWYRILDSNNYANYALPKSGGTISGNLTVTGAIVANGNVTAYSDRKLKANITKIENALDKICSIGGYTFDMLGTGQRQTGVIAQELEKVLPEAVIKNDNGYLSVDYGRITGLLVEGIKDLKNEIYELKQEIEELKGGK